MSKVTDTKTFISKAQELHGNHYDYSNTIYKASREKVTLKCNIHDCTFEQIASDHIRVRRSAKNGRWNGVSGGCKMCWNDNKVKNLTHTTESFIEKARSIHRDKFDYSHVNYTERGCRVDIKCKIHGMFQLDSKRHIDINYPQGCPDCSVMTQIIAYHYAIHTNKEDEDIFTKAKQIPCFVYVIKINNHFFKIGITTRTVQKRFESDSFQYEVIKLRKTNMFKAFKIEQRFLKLMEKQNRKYVPPTEVMTSGHTECFI